jgi:adenylate cyclase
VSLAQTLSLVMLASRAAMEQFRSALPVKVRSLGQLPIHGRADGIDVVGLDIPTAQGV